MIPAAFRRVNWGRCRNRIAKEMEHAVDVCRSQSVVSVSAAAGVDGCRAGWFYFRRDGDVITHGVAQKIHALTDLMPERSRVFIDIPIGLVEHGPSGRGCDQAARQLLGRKRSSVFSAPCRPVLAAKDYDEARTISLKAIGKKLSRQAFAIAPKIKEVDTYLQNRTRAVTIREVHPEVCFWALNDRQVVLSSKKTEAGFRDRLTLLRRYLPETPSLVDEAMSTYRRKDVARDDILDALVALVAASVSGDSLRTLPPEPATDSRGLPMEIVYPTMPDGHLK